MKVAGRRSSASAAARASDPVPRGANVPVTAMPTVPAVDGDWLAAPGGSSWHAPRDLLRCALSARSSVHVPADSIERQAKAPRRPAVEALLSSSTLPAVASDRGRDLNDEGRVALRQPRFTRWCPCASSATGERRSSPVPEAPDLTGCSRAPHAPLAGRRGLRHRAHRHPHAAAQRAARLQRLGGAVRRAPAPGEAAERRRDVARPYGRGCSAQVPCGECGVARLCVSRRTALVLLWEQLHMCRPLYL